MSVMHPHRPSHRFVLAMLLVDLPVLVAIGIVGFFNGYLATYHGVMEWRLSHPWSLLPSLVLAIVLVRRWHRSR